MRILITGARSPVAVEWATILRQGNHQVWLSDSIAWPLGRFTRSEQSYFYYPSPRFSSLQCAKAIEQFCLDKQIDLIIPTCEEVFHLAARLSKSLPLFASDASLLHQLHHKYHAMALLSGLGEIKTPVTELLTDAKHADQHKDKLLKPVFSRFGEQVIFPNKPRQACQPSKEAPWVAQQYLHGEPLCNYALFENGQLIAHQAYRPLWGLNGSAATAFSPIEHTIITEFTRQFGQQYAYHGQVAFDFIDTTEGTYVIECNPRATSGLHLLNRSIRLSPKGQWEVTAAPTRSQHIGVGLFFLFGIKAIREGEFQSLLSTFQRGSTVLSSSSLYPLASFFSLAAMAWRSMRRGISLTAASTWDIEWNGKEE